MAASEDIWEIDWDAYEDDFAEEADPYEYVLGLDPGETTGVAMLRYTPETKPELIYLHQIEGGRAGFWEFFRGTVPSTRIHIASEKWVEFSGKKGVNHEPLKIEGVEYTIWEDDITFQEPSQKQLIGDDYLKENNLWTPGHRHQMDALIHALIYLRNEEEHKPTLKSLSGDDEEPMAQPGQAEQAQLDQPDEREGEDGEGSIEEQVAKAMEQAAEQGSKAEQAMKEMAQQFEEVAKAMEALAEAMEGMEDGEGEQAGQPNGVGEGEPTADGGDNSYHDYEPDDIEPTGKRKRLEKNGVFMGYAPEESEEIRELFVD